MVVPDTSVWVEHLRRTSSPAHRTLQRLIDEESEELATTEVVMMEVLAGVSRTELDNARAQLLGLPVLELDGVEDYRRAANLYRDCRQQGITIRKLTDCLIAIPVIDADAELLHIDRDFDNLARCSPLQVHALDTI